tara:strand:+ start:20 stop:298 length:279 start_codon:yes stop_codon:yes gene_type:complete
MKVKLESGKELELKDLSIDERDELLDSVTWEGEGQNLKIKMMHSTMTKFIRIGVKGNVSDKFLKSLTFKDKSDIFTKIQTECMNLGEEKASK